MSKHRVAVLKVVTHQSSVTAAAAEVGLSRGHLQRLLRRYRAGGLEALEPRSRRPHTSPGRTPAAVRERIVALRTELTAPGIDAGPLTIAWHLEREGLRAPSSSTIRRVLHAAVYTARFTGGHNAFEYLLAYLGIKQKNGAPGHPQTQGKIERFHQTLKRWLAQRPAARTIPELQAQLDAFRHAYDEARPHRALGRRTPAEAYRASPKAHPAGRGAPGHLRLRYDLVDKGGRITLRRGGRLHHLGIGAAHARRRVLAIVDERAVTVVDLGTGEVLSSHLIAPDRGYWRNQRRDPGRWPGSQATR